MIPAVLINCKCELILERYEHLGLGHLKSYLAGLGMQSQVIDGHFHGLSPQTIAGQALAHDPVLIGFSIFFNNLAASIKTAKILRSKGYSGHICLGGHHASFKQAELLQKCPELDCVVLGEGELTLADLLARLIKGRPWQKVPGIARRDDQGRPAVNEPRELVAEIDELPFPDRTPYRSRMQHGGIANMASSRGCYASCGFCSVSAFYKLNQGRAWRPRSPENVVDEMELLARAGARHIHFVDDNFMGLGRVGRNRAMEIGREILRRGFKVSFDLDCRANDVHEKTLALLKKAGLNHVGSGIESMLPRQLELYGKKVKLEHNLKAIETLKRLGLEYHLYFVAIEPFVTIEELLETLDWMEKIGLEHILDGQILSWLVVLEGTSLLERLREEKALYNPEQGLDPDDFPWGRPYVVRDERVGQTLPHLHKLHAKYLELQQTYLLPMGADNSAVRLFVDQVAESLKRHKVGLIRELLLASQKGALQGVAPVMKAKLEQLEGDVKQLHQDWRQKAFDTMEPKAVQLGEESLAYPPPAIASLMDAVLQRLA